jgi:ATP-dependent DNA helicase DinG
MPSSAGTEPESDLTPLLDAAVEALGGETRPGQIQMAEAVAAALDDRVHLLVQAGTGTGKSLAYLVPALAHHKRVIVATATLALQRQLVAVDLPKLSVAVKPLINREPAFALLKGRNNYACLHKLEGGQEDDEQEMLFDPTAVGKLGQEVLRVREWAEESETGDRDDLSPGVSDRAWAQVSVSSRECLGSKCAYFDDCFAEHAKQLAQSADVVVTNHALLAIAAMDSNVQVLPEHDAVIVDEAHELVNRITSAATGELTKTAVERAHHRADKLVKEATGGNLAVATLDFTDALDNVPEGRYPRELPEELAAALAALRDATRAAITDLGKPGKNQGPENDAARKQARAANELVLTTATRILENSENDVIWLDRNEFKGNKVSTLKVAPLGIDTLLRQKIFTQSPVVLTSATLMLGGDFGAVAQSVGLYPNERIALDVVPEKPAELYDRAVKLLQDGESDGEEFLDIVQNLPQHCRALDVGSPFDYPKQGILYIARHLDSPSRDGNRDDQLDELADLVEAAGGRTLGLFSSMRGAQTAAEKLRARIDFPILCQGEDSIAELLRQFSDDPRTCLFGTLSLWQGVNVPGSSCQLVVIDRIPFPRPDDPLLSARRELLGAAAFAQIDLPRAAMLLAQATGRLIRNATDRGVVAVMDPRLGKANYRWEIVKALPPMKRTRHRAEAEAFLREITS